MDRSPANDLPDLDFSSPGNTNKHVVVVMDGMTEFTTDTLQWALDNVVTAGCILTLLGVMPWLNIPLFLKTRNDFWTEELEDAPPVKEKNGCGNDAKYLKRQAVIDLCRKYGVVPQKKIVMGYPQRLLVVEQVATLCPTWVVFDGVDMIKSRQMSHNGESISTELALSTPQMTVSEESKDTNK
ncbi:hypothetical protein JHK87_025655 [Glycine soja]|nr:hypothetical protein JHK87_025655 [Glycine soja]